eukprot:scaffold23801_cov82-Skeletonema_marinoi.AAC.2
MDASFEFEPFVPIVSILVSRSISPRQEKVRRIERIERHMTALVSLDSSLALACALYNAASLIGSCAL